VPLDLSHIGHAAHTEAEVLAVEGPCDGAGDAGLAHTRGAIEAEDLALGGATELANSNELLGTEAGSVGTLKLWPLSLPTAHCLPDI
jgi:hypothetical protein